MKIYKKIFVTIFASLLMVNAFAQGSKLPTIYKGARMFGASRLTAININRKLLGTTSKLAMPKLDKYAVKPIPSFKGLELSKVNKIPTLPWISSVDTEVATAKVYRGLALDSDGKALRNILENGLLLKDVGKYSSDFVGMSGKFGAMMVMSGQTKFNNLTDNPELAADYAKGRIGSAENQIAVVVEVTGIRPQSVIHYPNDIPASQISGVIALLELEGVPTWCRVELAEDGGYKITPYRTTLTKAPITQNIVMRDQVSQYKQQLLEGFMLTDTFLEGYYMRRIERYLPTPENRYGMGVENPEKLYRGMLITPDELETILEKGFSPKDSHWNVGTDGRDAVSFSSSSIEARDYIFHAAGTKKNAIGVVFEVENSPQYVLGTDEKLNRTKTIYYSYDDVPADKIIGVSIFHGEGTESLGSIVEKIKKNALPSRDWVKVFDNLRIF